MSLVFIETLAEGSDLRDESLSLKGVERLGFEPRTNWLKANCSTN